MKRIYRIAGLIALAMLGVAPAARAGGFKVWNVCGGNTFNTCASVRVDVVGTLVTMSVRNLSGLFGTYGGTVFTGIGLFNVPTSVDATQSQVSAMSGPVRTGDSPAAWYIRNNKQIGGGIQLDLVGQSNANNGAINNGIASNCLLGALPNGKNKLWMNPTCGTTGVTGASINGGFVVFSFNVDETWDPSVGTELLVKGQNGPNGASTECITGPHGNCGVVPEPVTMALLATGLTGMGGLGLIRRRRTKKEEPNA